MMIAEMLDRGLKQVYWFGSRVDNFKYASLLAGCQHAPIVVDIIVAMGATASPSWSGRYPGMAERASLVFRGHVVQVDLTKTGQEYKEGIALIAVDRWYRGARLSGSARVQVHFAYEPRTFFQGHNCSDLVVGSYWIFFAKPGSGSVLELVHDCEGALPISSLLASQKSGDILSEIGSDFRAGLSDSDADARLSSLQRLAGLALPASRDALKEVIARGDDIESQWAILADLKTGDISVLRMAIPLLVKLRHDEVKQVREANGMLVTRATPYPEPEGEIALAIEKLRDPGAVPALVRILNGAPDELVRSCAAGALSEIADARSQDTLAVHLSDPSERVRYTSLLGLARITHAPACSVAKPEDAKEAESRCKAWLESKR